MALELLDIGRTTFAIGFIVFLRIGAAMAVLPAFGERSIPQRLRLALALAFTLIVAPAVAPEIEPIVARGDGFVFLIWTEVIAGLALGLTLRLFVLVLQMAGTIAAQSTSLSQIFGTAALEPLPAIGHLLVVGGLALAAMTGLHVQVARALIGSYQVFPTGGFPDPSLLAEWGIARVASGFALAFTLAAPFVLASFVYNLTLGIINKAMPQLMVAFVGAPAITAGGLILLFLTMPLLLSVWNEQFQTFLANPFEAR
ncbi:flagellar biosynthetic protein FliR [Candidatus Rhodobacter oscarellae]|nr:flagellar biosynthetic protein FliR [Candidatus Rhodobacter lobularis]